MTEPEQIEITQTMVEAGLAAFWEFDRDYEGQDDLVVETVYRAMEEARIAQANTAHVDLTDQK